MSDQFHSPALTERTKKLLQEAGIWTLDELALQSEDELLSVPGVGMGVIKQINLALKDHRASLRVDEPRTLVEPFYESLRSAYAEHGDFGAVGETLGMSRQAAYELYFWSQKAAKSCAEQRVAHVKWKMQQERRGL